jgi:hypothetical protein
VAQLAFLKGHRMLDDTLFGSQAVKGSWPSGAEQITAVDTLTVDGCVFCQCFLPSVRVTGARQTSI